MRKRIRDYGIIIGKHRPGALNKITDVPGVQVGHATVDTEDHKTGVTVILPCEDNPFVNKLTAAAYVHNGFGKTTGTLQIAELGTLETPIALTNTLNVGLVQDALVDYMITKCRAEKVQVSTVNAVVGECNDGFLNRIRERAVGKEEVYQAIQSASRILELDGKEFVIGALVQSNFGSTENFMLNGRMLGRELDARIREKQKDEGSIMMVIGTDLPVSDRQLYRILRRAGVGLSRCGSFMGHGSGDIMLGFSTANRFYYKEERAFVPTVILREEALDPVFEAAAEAIEEAILNSLAMARTVTGYHGNTRYSFTDLYLEEWERKRKDADGKGEN